MAIRARLLALPAGVVATALAASLLLAACSSSRGTDTPSTTSASSGSSSPTTAAPPTSQTVAMGRKVSLPRDTIGVSAFADHVAPKATRPDAPGTHWASATVRQCATGASRQGRWELALADGGTAPETESWVEGELPHQLQPSSDPLAAGDCVAGDVYFVMPDGATAVGVVLQPVVAPGRAQVTWTLS